MPVKIFLFALITMIAFQNIFAEPSGQIRLDPGVEEALIRANQARYDITVKLETLGQEAIGKISALLDDVKSQSEKLIARATSRIEGIEAMIDYKSQDLMKIAADLDVDTKNCVTLKNASVEQLVNKTVLGVVSCKDNEVAIPVNLILNISATIKTGYISGKDMEKEIEKCLKLVSAWPVISCLTTETQRVELETINLSYQIRKAAMDGEMWGSRALTDVSVCVAVTLIETERPAADIITELSSCVVEKINESLSKRKLSYKPKLISKYFGKV